MILKFMPVLARVFALAQPGATAAKQGAIAAIAATTIAMTPVVAKAQIPLLTELFPVLSGVELTTQQKIQLAELASNTQTQIEKIVTADQRNQFRTALGQGKGFGEAMEAMNVTPDQQRQIQGVFVSTRTQLISTFTPPQRQKILDNVRSLLQLPPTP